VRSWLVVVRVSYVSGVSLAREFLVEAEDCGEAFASVPASREVPEGDDPADPIGVGISVREVD
jgi:hypothetical protein